MADISQILASLRGRGRGAQKRDKLMDAFKMTGHAANLIGSTMKMATEKGKGAEEKDDEDDDDKKDDDETKDTGTNSSTPPIPQAAYYPRMRPPFSPFRNQMRQPMNTSNLALNILRQQQAQMYRRRLMASMLARRPPWLT